jgi:hypothetical protein
LELKIEKNSLILYGPKVSIILYIV